MSDDIFHDLFYGLLITQRRQPRILSKDFAHPVNVRTAAARSLVAMPHVPAKAINLFAFPCKSTRIKCSSQSSAVKPPKQPAATNAKKQEKQPPHAIATWAIVFLMTSVPFVALWLSTFPVFDTKDPNTQSLTATLATFLSLAGKPAMTAILTSINLVTMGYGLWFYCITCETGKAIRAITVSLFFIVYFLMVYASLHSLTITDPNQKHRITIFFEYAIAVGLLIYFAIVDFWQSKNLLDEGKAALCSFSCSYISIPAIVASLIALFLHYRLIGHGISESDSRSFLVGVTAMIVLYSNLILAFVSEPAYFPSLEITRGNKT